MRSLYLILTIISSISPCAQSWGKDGHEVVANIAWNLLTPNIQQAAYNVLFPDNDFNATDHTSPLAAVATWADKVRFTKFFAWTTPLHYVDVKDGNIKGGCPVIPEHEQAKRTKRKEESRDQDFLGSSNCTFIYDRDCAAGHCAVGAIVDFAHLSAHPDESLSTRIPVWQRQRGLRGSASFKPIHNVTQRQSLMFLIHIIGDIHQPLHVSRETDRGGNTIDVSFPKQFGGFLDERFGHSHSGWNLHSVWDEAIIQRSVKMHHNSSQYFFQLSIEEELVTMSNVKEWRSCEEQNKSINTKECAEKWAKESFKDALTYAYANEDGKEIVSGEALTEAYFESRLGIVRRRLAAGGVRLAASLESVFQEHHDSGSALVLDLKSYS